MNRTDRLMAMLLEFQARRELRAEDLARRFEVSVRTIYRDVAALSESGVPIAAMPGIGYRLLDGYFLPPLSFTEDEAAALALGGGFVRDRVDPELRRAAEEALRKLEGVLSQERRQAVARRRREMLFPTAARESEEGTLSALRAAIGERRVVRMRYHALWRPTPEEREVEPVSLVHVGRGWHLAAYCRLRQAPRIFLLGRIDKLEPLGERFTVGVRHELGPGGEGWTSFPEARVRFDASVVRWVREQQPYPFLREEPGGEASAVFVYALRNEAEMLNWLLGWGAKAEVLGPPQLRERLVKEARAIVRRHVGEEAQPS
ncbi:MAG: Transcriptional regulator, DeoR family [uncultured Thermomicrobiales bacterium]|uniref:Transcriptional regulator, DeoR family n=1 Tax=uncultured Thermomicrobiales bacterium TaxID=1645740 RepID=A0A6J4VRD3_9BACT|nr:MAG: Transcriptional regulator, DeoR family [uncultured Thermomicrobiales bacterium]